MKWHVGSSIMFLVIVLVLSACGASKTAEAPMLPQSPLPDVDEERTEPTPSPTLNVEEDSMETHASTNSIFPVTIEEWRNETQNRSTEFTREGDHYWRYGPGGTYTIGGWTDDDWDNNDAQADVALEEYWVARYPVTVQQYRAFIEDGGYDTEDYWTPEGWEWKVELGHTQPYLWGDEHLSDDNQPVVGVTWYEATAFANWLTAKLELPAGTIRLPTEAEWEAACAYDANGQRHPYPWGEQEPTRNLADFDDGSDPDRPASVGERPEGAAASGAQDLVGSVWEWTTVATTVMRPKAGTWLAISRPPLALWCLYAGGHGGILAQMFAATRATGSSSATGNSTWGSGCSSPRTQNISSGS